jgi:hypothetical protein
MKSPQHVLAIGISGLLALTCLQVGCATQASALEKLEKDQPFAPAATELTQSAPQPPADLDPLVAPIALYPDALIAQILAASTYPTQVIEADRWMQQNSNLKGQPLAEAVDQQSWDPSVKALTQFPSVLAMMDTNLAWTSALGEAYASQSQSVLAAIQVMRGRAQQAGYLESTPQESVTNDGQTIVIEPASPDIVYVPEYDPWVVYGAPIALYPGWTGVVDYAPGVYFGVGVGIGFLAGFDWGWRHWDADWHGRSVWFHHHPYFSHSPTFQHADPGRGAFGHPDDGARDHPNVGHGGLRPADLSHSNFGGGNPGHTGFAYHGTPGIHTGVFGGFNHGGVVGAYSARGQASFGGGMHAGGFHAGSFGGGGFHGGGAHR